MLKAIKDAFSALLSVQGAAQLLVLLAALAVVYAYAPPLAPPALARKLPGSRA